MNTDKNRYKNRFQISNVRFRVKKISAFICVHLWLISLCFFLYLPKTKAQIRPVYDYGAIGLGQLLKRLNNTKSAMHIGAHPDDEDSALLAYLARGENARTAYLSLTRGDGGQNRLGKELSESLGIIRTEELLQARRLDGAEQFFTRAFDYGFSKTLAEAKEKWDEKIILCDTVRAIRTFRPLVVISRFSGTPADGHGQHQFAGYIAPLAVKAAADAKQCADAGAPWQVLKFYVSQGFRSENQPTLRINTGEYDFLLGRSYFEIAMEGRSQHKTQEQGALELRGEQFSGLNLVESKAALIEKDKSIFDGIDFKLSGFIKQAGLSEEFYAELLAIEHAANAALENYEIFNPQKIIPVLSEGLKRIRELQSLKKNKKDVFDDLLEQKESEFEEAIRRASRIAIDAFAEKEIIAPGESFLTIVKVFFPNAASVKVKEITLKLPPDWQVSKTSAPKETTQSFRRETANETNYFNVRVSEQTKPTQPFWLENKRGEFLFDWEEDENQNQPFQKPIVTAQAKLEVNGIEIFINRPVEYRFAEEIRGEVRRELNVVPKISLSLDQKLLIVPKSDSAQTRKIALTLTNNSSTTINGTTNLKLPIGWKIKQNFGIFQSSKKGESKSFKFDVIIPADTKAGGYNIQASAESGEQMFNQTLNEIAYPHIQTHRFYTKAETKVNVLDLKVAPVKVGYIMGSGDDVPEAIRQMNLNVELLNENDLSGGDLSRFDVIVAGIRASEVRQDFVANNQRLLDYVKNGGSLIVQYQRPDYLQKNLAPFPAQMGARVSDENAKVVILEPNHAVFNYPNKITETDFQGWIQERNLYNFTVFDPKYTPFLESHDADEAENKGGMVYARIGKGNYIYTSYSFFRQLPAGVPGAYRLFANLLSLPKAERKSNRKDVRDVKEQSQ